MEFFLQGLTFPLVTTYATLAIACQILSIIVIVLLLCRKRFQTPLTWLSRNSLLLMFLVALAATGGSLFFSEVALWAPCKLCWFQRIFMYPQLMLLTYALWKKEWKILPYVLILSIIGICISAFHYGEQILSMLDPIGHDSAEPCDLSGISCRATYIFEYGYITIPMLAFTAFLCNILLSTTALLFHKNDAIQSATVDSPSVQAPSAHTSHLSILAVVLAGAALIVAFIPRFLSSEDIELKLTPKAQLETINAVEGIHWTHTPAAPLSISRTDQKKVVVEWEATEMIGYLDQELGLQYAFWGFEGSSPGPTLRVRQGDLVELRLTNNIESEHPHNIDFHFSTGPGGGAMALNVAPGDTAVVHLRATHPGFFMYHCATPDIPTHIANGMYGGVIVDPINTLPEVDQEFIVVQSEFYTDGTQEGLAELDLEALDAENPSHVVFNGAVGSLTGENSPYVNVGDTVRLYVLNAGPQLISSFHVIGEIFDRVYRESDLYSPPGRGIQSTLIPAGGAAIVDFLIDVPGTYILVDHAIARAIHKGAIGTIIAEGENNPEIYESFATEEWVDGHTHNGEEPEHKPEVIEEEPEDEEPLEAAENEVFVEIMKGSMKKDDDPTNDYSPNILTVPVGTTVTWINKDVSVHTVTDRGRLFNSGNMRKGKKWSYTFTEIGEFDYYCIPHPWMVGKVIVE